MGQRINRDVMTGLLASIALAACGGGNNDGNAALVNNICSAIPQSLVSSSANTGSTLNNPNLAVDGNFATYATLTPTAANGGGSIRGAGTSTQPAGSAAGTAFTTPTTGTLSVTITTYLGGTQQESGSTGTQSFGNVAAQNCTSPGVCDYNSSTAFFGIKTTKSYDSFQATFAVSGNTNPIDILELCVQ